VVNEENSAEVVILCVPRAIIALRRQQQSEQVLSVIKVSNSQKAMRRRESQSYTVVLKLLRVVERPEGRNVAEQQSTTTATASDLHFTQLAAGVALFTGQSAKHGF
jgi:hypothetical protein